MVNYGYARGAQFLKLKKCYLLERASCDGLSQQDGCKYLRFSSGRITWDGWLYNYGAGKSSALPLGVR